MQHVKHEWLRLYNYALVFVTIGLFSAYLVFEYLEVGPDVTDKWGITPVILIIGFVHSIYVLFIYPLLNRRFTLAANFVSFAIFAGLMASIIETSGNTNTMYRLSYALFIFFTALNGWITPVIAITLTWIVLLFTLVGLATPTNATITYNFVINTIVTISGLTGWYIFKRWYIKKADKEAVQLESLLKQEQFKSGLILESITDGVLVTNSKGTIQVINESAATMLGWPKQEATNLDYRSVVQPHEEGNQTNDADQTAISLSLKSNKSEQKISLIKTHNQRQIYVDIVASPIFQSYKDPETNKVVQKTVGVIAVLRNVDEQKRQEKQRSDFISTASHEMRTPVAAIQGFIELALNPKVTVIDEKAKGYLLKAHEATEHLGQLFQDLLTVSKSDDGRLGNKPRLIEIREFLKNVVEEERMSAEEKGLKIIYEADGQEDKKVAPLLYVNVDPDRLREVVTNIIENAIKYTPSGIITVGANSKEQGVVVRVSDTGMGIAAEDIPHLFQKFYRTDNTATREIGGTGLGLYICKQIIEMMSGKIWVESTVGAGSTFYVEIPRVPPEQIQNRLTPET